MRLDVCSPVLVCLTLLNCGPGRPGNQGQPGPEHTRDSGLGSDGREQITGRVFRTGSNPEVSITLVPSQGPSIRLVGGLQDELARLSGATVRVRGVSGGQPPRETFEAASYDILQIDGQVPMVGTILAQDGTVRLAGRDTLELANPPEGLRAKIGAKVWIVGEPAGNKLDVKSYGIIRERGK